MSIDKPEVEKSCRTCARKINGVCSEWLSDIACQGFVYWEKEDKPEVEKPKSEIDKEISDEIGRICIAQSLEALEKWKIGKRKKIDKLYRRKIISEVMAEIDKSAGEYSYYKVVHDIKQAIEKLRD